MNKKLVYYLIVILPIIDLITSLQVRFGINFSFGMLFKGIIILISLYYLIFISKSKYKKFTNYYLILILLFILGYFIFKRDLINSLFFTTEMTYLFKMLFFPIMFITFLNYFSEYGFNKNKFIKAMSIDLILYTLFLIIPKLTGTSFNSYDYGLHGEVGWFFSANEVSVIVLFLLPFMYVLLNKNKFCFLFSFIVLFAISSIGTKSTLIGVLAITIVSFISILFKEKFKFNSKVIKTFIILLFSIFLFFNTNSSVLKNINQKAEVEEFELIETPQEEETDVSFLSKISDKSKELIQFLLSDRDVFLKQTNDIYKTKFSYDYLMFGMGFSNTLRVNNQNVTKLIEIDYFDLFYHTGILSLIIVFLPFIYTFVKIINKLSKSKNNLIFIFYNTFIIILVLSAAGLSGHVLFFPAVSIYLALYLVFLLDGINHFNLKKIKDNKISILALHLKEGGIETVIVNDANMLSKKYDVEIISLYKNDKKLSYDLNKNVKVKYLMNTISNKDKIIKYKNNHEFVNLIIELFKAIKILMLKNKLLRNEILKSDSKVIISSRKEFSLLLGKYKRDEIVTIGQEHNYHKNDKKIITSVVKANKNIDYFMPTSKELCDFYKPIIKAKTEYIQNIINFFPNKINTLNNKKIFTVGRLSNEKGFETLIDVMSKVVKKDKEITLDIYGDGILKDKLNDLIIKLNLENNVFLKGYIENNKLNDIRKDYSLFALTSYEESFGLAALEAMSFGIPVIMFDDAKGPLEFINDENGIIIQNRDINKMAENVVNLFNDKKRLSILGKNAYNKSLEYKKENVEVKYNEFIENIISMSKYKNKKVLFISSTGGHFNELMQLKKLFNYYDYQIITEKKGETLSLEKKYPYRIHFLKYGTKLNKVSYFCYIFPFNILKSFYYFIKYKPNYIVTTGTHTAVPMCYIAKLFGSKVVYIETFANISSKTVAGKLVYPIADLFIVQWEEMLKLYPKAVYGGWIY